MFSEISKLQHDYLKGFPYTDFASFRPKTALKLIQTRTK